MNDSAKAIGTSFVVLVVIAAGIVLYSVASILNIPSMLRDSSVAATAADARTSVSSRSQQSTTPAETARRMSAYRHRIDELKMQVSTLTTLLDAQGTDSAVNDAPPAADPSLPPPDIGEDSALPAVEASPRVEVDSGADLRAMRASVAELLDQLADTDDARLLLVDSNEELALELESLSNDMALLEEISTAATRETRNFRVEAARAAAGALDQLGPDAMELLMRSLDDERLDIQIWAVEVLEHMGEQAVEALPMLRQLARDDDARLRQSAQDAIRTLEGN